MVMKDKFGSFGQQIRLVPDMKLLARELSGPYIQRVLQRYVGYSATEICLEVVGAEFSGVDIIRTPDVPAVEVNSNVYIKNLKDCTCINTSYDILRRACDIVTEDRYGLLDSV